MLGYLKEFKSWGYVVRGTSLVTVVTSLGNKREGGDELVPIGTMT